MTVDEAKDQVDSIWKKFDPDTHKFADWLEDMLSNPAFPMLLRVAAMARICGTVGVGLLEAIEVLDGEPPISLNALHRNDLLPHIPGMLRAAADLYEAAEQLRSAPDAAPPVN